MRNLVILLSLILLLPSAGKAQSSGSATLDGVRARGALIGGVSGPNPGFAFPDKAGEMRGSEADFCRAVAAATLGDASKVNWVILTSTTRFTALQSGEIDLLVRTATWTLGREASLGLMFAGTTFYDGTGFMVKTESGVTSASQLNGATVCILPGTSTELAVADYFRDKGMQFTPILIENVNGLRAAFMAGRCDAYSTDASALASTRFNEGPNADKLLLLPEIISKEPLGPFVRKGDDKWFDIVRWTHFAMLQAEELGLTSTTVDAAASSTAPDIRRLLGAEGGLGKALGLDDRWAYAIIKQVGNYGEVFERNITPLGLARGHNALWTAGGFQFAPAMR